MGKTIEDQPDIGRALISTDLLLVDADAGGGARVTSKSAFSRIMAFFRFRKNYYTAAGAETYITIADLDTASFSIVWQGITPLPEHGGALPVPAGMYKADYAAKRIYFGDALGATEKILTLYN